MNSTAEKPAQRPPSALGPLERLGRLWRRHDRLLYASFAAVCTVYVASIFYGYMHVQTGGRWSAPLDDVFIHFDYARSFARGYPFQWSEGNGYSSGNTSLTYPVVLAFGYWIGLRTTDLMVWAAAVAGLSVYGFLTLGGRLLERPHVDLGRSVKYLLPPALLSLGALDWSLWSGMENAFHLVTWAAFMAAALHQSRSGSVAQAWRRGWWTGLLGALLVATRPESAICVAVAGFYCALRAAPAGAETAAPRRKRSAGLAALVSIGLPGVVLLGAMAAVNYLLTGEHQANGAVAKLFVNNPYMSAGDMWNRYTSLLGYIVPRLTEHHFADARPWGYLLPALGAVPLASRRTRAVALMLWLQIVGWMLLVGLNNQLRWHNERYAMPAVAWLVLLAVMGLGLVAATPWQRLAGHRLDRPSFLLRVALAAVLCFSYWQHQRPRFRDQVWFFGRASRNILDQHVTAGRLITRMGARRVLVGDAGAIIYASDRPGLDLIGLGGFDALPFARSAVHGLGASLELIERIPTTDRPDVMAIYPSWWSDLPVYFGRYVTSVPVFGNVICGGSEKVIYQADWSPLDQLGAPRSINLDERVVDGLDVADLLSEQAHDYRVTGDRPGFVRFRVLADPSDPMRDLFDAGRIVPAGTVEQATLLAPPGPARLLIRIARPDAAALELAVDGAPLGRIALPAATSGWQEVSTPLPDDLAGSFTLGIRPVDGESVHYHLWVLGSRSRRE